MDLSGGEPPFLTCTLLKLSGANEVECSLLCTLNFSFKVE
jgi:hypothetical protein